MVFTQLNNQKNSAPTAWGTATSKFHILRQRGLWHCTNLAFYASHQKSQNTNKNPKPFIWGQMVKTQSIYLLHKEQKKGATVSKHNRIFMDKSLNTTGCSSNAWIERLPNSLRVPIILLQHKKHNGHFPTWLITTFNPCGKSFCYRRSKQHLPSKLFS